MACSAIEMPVKLLAAGQRHDGAEAKGSSTITVGEDGCSFPLQKAGRPAFATMRSLLYEHVAQSESS